MDDPPLPTPAPTPGSRRSARKLLDATALLGIGLTFVLVVSFLLASISLDAVAWGWGVGIPLAIAAVWAWFLSAGQRLRARAEGLELLEVVRGPAGTVLLARGQLGGYTVRVFRDRIEVDVATPQAGHLDGATLSALAESPSGPYAPAQEAAAQLVARGVRSVEIAPERVILRGQGWAKATDVVPAAVSLALAPARIRFAPSQPHASGCPYCHETVALDARTPAVRCPSCESVHHAECWQEHGGCSVHRCRRAPPMDRDRAAEAALARRDELRASIQVRERA